jgi:hypothetical protein
MGTPVSELHPLKALLPMVVIPAGRTIVSSEEQLLNIEPGNSVMAEESDTTLSEEQPENILLPRLVTLFGISMLCSPLQLLNA